VLTPGRSAVVAEIDEDWTAPSTTRSRRSAAGLSAHARLRTETQAQRSIDALKKDLRSSGPSLAVAARVPPRLQARIDAPRRAWRASAPSRRRAARPSAARPTPAGGAAREGRAATGDLKAKQEQRIVAVERAYGEWLDRMDAGRTEFVRPE
jgi:hypothetical protein